MNKRDRLEKWYAKQEEKNQLYEIGLAICISILLGIIDAFSYFKKRR